MYLNISPGEYNFLHEKKKKCIEGWERELNEKFSLKSIGRLMDHDVAIAWKISEDIKKYVQKNGLILCHITEKEGLKHIRPSVQTRNMYGKYCGPAIYGCTDPLLQILYAGRAVAGKMQVAGYHNVTYPEMPFEKEKNGFLLLKKPVYRYWMDINDFLPVLDFFERADGGIGIRFDSEWISFKREERVLHTEKITGIKKEIVQICDFKISSIN